MRRIERLLRGRGHPGRRTASAPVSDEEAELLATAIELRAARPGADTPREEFVSALRRKIATDIATTPKAVGPRRRRFLAGASVAAASAAAAVAADRVLSAGDGHDTEWHPVMASTDLTAGQVRRFEVGPASGFVLRRRNGTVSAVSGVCTHLGCLLSLNASAARL